MNMYEIQINKELDGWHNNIVKDASIFERASKGIQKKTQKLTPPKVQDSITVAVKSLVETVLHGSGIVSVKGDTSDLVLAERDYLVINNFRSYLNTATVQGAGFGFGGILLGMADLPVLMSIKVKFMFDAAKLYGFDPKDENERLYILHIFQLAFSGKEHRLKIFRKLEDWDNESHEVVDWEKFQIEYRDYLDVAKMLQLLPIVGSVFGGTANHKLMNRLRENVMNCYRMRILDKKFI